MDQAGKYIADAVLGIDTLWGGDVMCPSGTGRFIADSWFSDEPLPAAYMHPAAARLRESGGVSGKTIDRDAVDEYLREVDLPQAIAGVRNEAGKIGGLRKPYLIGLGSLSRCHVGPGHGSLSAKAIQCRTHAVSRRRQRSRLNHPGRKQSGNELPSCWVGLVIRRMRAGCWMQSMPGAMSAYFQWPQCAPWARL